MLIIHSVLALSVIFNNCLYIAKPPNAEKAYITFDKHLVENQTRWTLMEHSQLGGIDIFKILLLKNTSKQSILPYKVKFYSKGYMSETLWQYSIQKEPPACGDNLCKGTFILLVTISCISFFIMMVIALYRLKDSCTFLFK